MVQMTMIMVPLPSAPYILPIISLMGEQLQGVLDKLVRQEDDSGVNHLWKGEMLPARVGLIHARRAEHQRSRCKQLKQLSVSCRDLF